ncbi:MAG TPA: hypothetical protein VH061_11360 [Solirubrobacteraceae bacterium]|jgi:Tol biopolymer transport system component|nr:hypothetical protein [Solirubrobacteraceae bacterium]
MALVLALVLLSAGAPGARADVFGAISLDSASSFGQAEYAHDPTLSEDGRYVVFDGSVGGVPGVWRHRAEVGAPFEQVAGGDAVLPSVSADGRYVSFTTNEGASLPAITDGVTHTGEPNVEAPGVYVRDMNVAPSEAGAFTLASAKDHSALSLTYEFPGVTPEQEQTDLTKFGATAAGRSAITADGRSVAFVTTAQSDLAGPQTPPMQVAVRHLDTQETQLVSVRYDPTMGRAAVDPEGATEPVKLFEGIYGAVWSKSGPPPFATTRGLPAFAYKVTVLPGASISADGSTVAWLGQQIPEQAAALSEEAPELGLRYAEPLWRRISGGPLEPTRRVTGGSEPESPACQASGETRLPLAPSSADPCQGPFATQVTGGLGTWNFREEASVTPRLSADGDEVAFISSAPLTGEVGGFGIGGGEFNSDAYVADMTAANRKSALRQLTQFASGDITRISTNSDISDIGISPDGTQVAFTTRRSVFPLGVPAYVSVPAAVPGLVEVYDADLADDTLTRVTQGYEGGAAAHSEHESTNEDPYSEAQDGATSPSFSADGAEIAFASTASNLVFGDGNTPPVFPRGEFDDGADVFLVPRITFTTEPTPQTISPPPGNPSLEPPWGLTVSASSLANGAVQLRVKLPGAGKLAASATSALPARASSRAGKKVKRIVARATAKARPGVIKLQLRLGGRYRGLASRRGGLPGTVTITFTAGGHPTLRKTLKVHFVHRSAKRKPGGRR